VAADDSPTTRAAAQVARGAYGRILAYLAYTFRDLAAAEDALAEAFASALKTWPIKGVPAAPEAWLMTAAKRNLLQMLRHGRLERDPAVTLLLTDHDTVAVASPAIPDERLKLLFACAHPAIDASIRSALMLQTVLGVEAEKIAAAFVVSPSTMAQRLVRAKAKIKLAGIRFEEPELRDLPERIHNVLEAIYALYGLSWDDHVANDFAQEAIYLADVVASLLPLQAEPAGLLALMLLCESRQAARHDSNGLFVPLHQQDARRWDRHRIEQANQILAYAASLRSPGPFQLEAAIQSAHCQRLYTGVVPWASIAQLYTQLIDIAPTLGAHIAHAVASAETYDATQGLTLLDSAQAQYEGHAFQHYQPLAVARAYLLAKLGQTKAARAEYEHALTITTSSAQWAYLKAQIAQLPHQ
jgi:RNA polymerase sigma-70 factor, ECF subfamily